MGPSIPVKNPHVNHQRAENFVQVGSNAASSSRSCRASGFRTDVELSPITTARPSASMATATPATRAAEQRILLQRPADQLAGHHGGWRARVRSGLQLRYAGQSQSGHDRRNQDPHLEFQRGKPEGSGSDQFRRQVGRPRFHGSAFFSARNYISMPTMAVQLQPPAQTSTSITIPASLSVDPSSSPSLGSTRTATSCSSLPVTSISTKC